MEGDRKILSLRFNQDQGCFSCCMESGFRIYNVEPLVEKCHYDVELVGSIGKCEMLARTNIFALVSGGTRPMYPNYTLLIYNDLVKKVILEISFSSPVEAVRLRKDKLIVVLRKNIHVFSFPAPTQRLYSLETVSNPRGLCELSPASTLEKQVLIFPGHKLGSLQFLDLASTEMNISSAPVWITAHKQELACLAFNQQGTKIATASVQGTIIRIWDAMSKEKVLELRRGTDTATIYCLNFSKNSDFLCCSSDKGTVHIFAVNNPELNKKSKLNNTNLLGSYGSSHWSLANFTVPRECACICAFVGLNAVVAACVDGTFHKYVFTKQGSCNREAYDVFLDVYDDDENLL